MERDRRTLIDSIMKRKIKIHETKNKFRVFLLFLFKGQVEIKKSKKL